MAKELEMTEEDADSGAHSRRAFVRRASAATFLTTVASQSVWAGQCSVSGHLSGNLSNVANSVVCTLTAYSPGAWRNGSASELWSYVPVSRTSFFFIQPGGTGYGVFPYPYSNNEVPITLNFEQALKNGGGGWERQAAAAWLNAKLWEYATANCTNLNSLACTDVLGDIDGSFYFDGVTPSGVVVAYPWDDDARSAWESAQTID